MRHIISSLRINNASMLNQVAELSRPIAEVVSDIVLTANLEALNH